MKSVKLNHRCIKQYPLTQGFFKIIKILTIVRYATNSSFTDNSKFTYTLANILISRSVVMWQYRKFNCASYLITITLCLGAKIISQNVAYRTNRAIFTRITHNQIYNVFESLIRYFLHNNVDLETV